MPYRAPPAVDPRDEVRPPVSHDPVVVQERSRGGGARLAGLQRWPVRPLPGGARQGNPMAVRSSQAVDRVDAVAPCIGLDGDGGAGGDPGPGGLTVGLPAHPVPAWPHAGSAHAARRTRSRLRQSGACHLAPGSTAATAELRTLPMHAFMHSHAYSSTMEPARLRHCQIAARPFHVDQQSQIDSERARTAPDMYASAPLTTSSACPPWTPAARGAQPLELGHPSWVHHDRR
jgi:hypothetical protein